MPEREGKRYLVIFSIAGASQQRLAEIVPRIKPILDRLSTEPIEQAFHSNARDSFGYLIRSRLHARRIGSTLQGPGDAAYASDLKAADMPFLSNDDGVFVLEVGEDFHATRGFSRTATWLQHH